MIDHRGASSAPLLWAPLPTLCKTRLARLVALAVLFVAPALLAAQPAVLADNHVEVKSALQELDGADMDARWQFTMTVQQDDELRVVRHDPTRARYEQRQLISVDGKPPEKKQLKKFQEEEKKRIDDRDPETSSYQYLVDPNTLALINTDAGKARYTFSPRVAALEKDVDKLEGHLLLNTATGKIDEIAISNAEPMSPAFSVKLEHYSLIFHFAQEQGERLLHRMESDARGKLGFLKKFSSTTNIEFGQYESVRVAVAP